MRDPKERLRDILGAIAAIERDHGESRESFETDELLEAYQNLDGESRLVSRSLP